VFFSELELSVRGKDRGLTEGRTMHLYESKAVQILKYYIILQSQLLGLEDISDVGTEKCDAVQNIQS
jgi:hypothetical protein